MSGLKMNSPMKHVIALLGSSAAVATLMLAVAWLKRGAPTGSVMQVTLEAAIIGLVIVALCLPLIFVRTFHLSGGPKNA
jgi:predicted permease